MAIPTWTPPAEFDEYRLVRPLGHGAMGQVWLARDCALQRDVAVKFLAAARQPDRDVRERFLFEARAVARLAHPNVVTVHRVGSVEDAPYIVTEWLEGESLDCVRRPLGQAQLLKVALGLARGLAAAHRRGVLHRDVKPANAFLTVTGDVKLLDFGLAKLSRTLASASGNTVAALAPVLAPDETLPGPERVGLEPGGEGPALTRAGAIIGTPLYLAPEGWRGEGATARLDVYALGALLYELTAGQAPATFLPHALSLGARVTTLPMRPLREVASHALAGLAELVDRCLAIDPLARPADAGEVLLALEALQPRTAPDASAGNPYRGLAAWEAEHRGTFFGRTAETIEALERLKSDGAVIVSGASGIGKSSLVRAGVLPAVREGLLGDGLAWRAATVLPGRNPRAALCRALALASGSAPDELERALEEGPLVLLRAVRVKLGVGAGLLLFVDQLEELVTFATPGEAGAVAAVLAELTRRVPGLALVATLRHDLLGRVGALPELGQNLVRCLYLLNPIAPEALRLVVAGPAGARGVRFESDAVVARLVDFSREGGALPLLQFTLASLWDTRDRERQLITAGALDALGGPAGALGRYADGVLERLPAAQRPSAGAALVRLVGEGLTRVRREAAELTERERAMLDELVRARLVVVRDGPTGSSWELAHEALAREWETLRQCVSENESEQKVRQRLSAASEEWERLNRASDALWSGRQLLELQRLAGATLPARDAAFVSAARRRARLRQLAVPLGVAVVLGVAGSAWGLVRLSAARELERRVDVRLQRADAAEARRAAAQAHAETAERSAFAAFDAADTLAGEARWRAVREARAAWATATSEVLSELEGALVLSPDARVQRRLAEAVLAQAELDEALGTGRLAASRARLAGLDASGALVERLDAPAHLSVKAPPGAAVRVVSVGRHGGGAAPQALSPLGLLETPLAPGSWLVHVERAGAPPVVLPLALKRGEALRVEVDVPGAVPEGFVYVPRGRFLYGAPVDDELRTVFFEAAPQHEVHTGSYFIGRTEVTFRAWLEYLRAQPRAERARRLPRTRALGGYEAEQGLTLVEHEGRYTLQLRVGTWRYTAREGQPLAYLDRERRATQDWLDFPVAGISADDAAAYAAWLDTTGRVPGARLCTELEWERAARGADGRWFPGGDALAPDDGNIDETYGRRDRAFGPDAVGSHPASASPFGAHDMLGNVWELVRSSTEPDAYVIRGGSWYTGQLAARSVNRWHATRDFRFVDTGVRLCATPR